MVAIPFSAAPVAARAPERPTASSIPLKTSHFGLSTIDEGSKSESPALNAVTDSYRARYAAYLSATFGISIQAASADVESALAPRKRSDVSEESVDAFKDRSIL